MDTVRLLVTGSRDWTDWEAIWDDLVDRDPQVVIHGAARGADRIAGDIAYLMGVETIEAYPAWWGWYGKGAGPERNGRMLAQSRPTAALAYPGSGTGTMGMVKMLTAAAVPVLIVWERDQL